MVLSGQHTIAFNKQDLAHQKKLDIFPPIHPIVTANGINVSVDYRISVFFCAIHFSKDRKESIGYAFMPFRKAYVITQNAKQQSTRICCPAYKH